MNQTALCLSIMNMKRFQKLLLIWMIVWLPIAGARAAVMPLSGMMASSSASDTASVGDQDMAAMPCHGDDNQASGKNSFGQSCTHCMLCHLAGALVMPEMPLIPMIAPAHIFDTASPIAHPSFIPDPTAPPPRRSLA